MDILLKLLLINQDNQFKLFTLSMPLMDIKQEPLIMVFNSISTQDLNIQLMELDRTLRCTLFIYQLEIQRVDLWLLLWELCSLLTSQLQEYQLHVAIIDEFFEALQWDKTSAKDSETAPLVEKVPYGKLMMMFDMRNRWTYKGSVTTPPCA